MPRMPTMSPRPLPESDCKFPRSWLPIAVGPLIVAELVDHGEGEAQPAVTALVGVYRSDDSARQGLPGPLTAPARGVYQRASFAARTLYRQTLRPRPPARPMKKRISQRRASTTATTNSQ